MEIREAVSSDIEEIVDVLRLSLGETDLPLSEEVWLFKHVRNPFGESIVLVAEEDGQIIGVRAFMNWNWQVGDQVYKACRAVDTATHPGHQGKGVFKKLTLKAIEIAKENGYDFIFNTPNEKSRPGYLKMGWETAGKIRVGIKPVFTSFFKRRKDQPAYTIIKETTPEILDDLCERWNVILKRKNKKFTPKSSKYLHWRFEQNALKSYLVYADANMYIAGHVKQHKKISELRISELIFVEDVFLKEAKKKIGEWSSIYSAHFISFSPGLAGMTMLPLSGNIGPVLTVRNLSLSTGEYKDALIIKNWAHSLGDMELF